MGCADRWDEWLMGGPLWEDLTPEERERQRESSQRREWRRGKRREAVLIVAEGAAAMAMMGGVAVGCGVVLSVALPVLAARRVARWAWCSL